MRPHVLCWILAFAAGALWPSAMAGQTTGTLTGTVVHAETGLGVSGVHVRVLEGNSSAVTDGRGRFLLAGLPAGSVTVSARRIGLVPVERAVEIRSGETSSVELVVESEALSVAGVLVTASREAERIAETAASVGVVSGAEIRERGAAHPSEALGGVPGVLVNVTGGEGHMTAIRQPITTDPVYLYLEDGVPTRSTGFFNHNALYEVNVPQAGSVEVVKGPGTALHGSDAIGGVINVETRPAAADPELEARIEGGGFGWRRMLLSGSASGERDGVRADVNLTMSDGWRDATDYDRQSATLRWDRALAGGARMKTVAAFSRIEQQTAGTSMLPEDVFREDPGRNLTPISFRSVRAFRVSTELSGLFGRGSWSVTPFVRSNRMDLLPDWSLTFDPAVWETGNSSVGLLARVRRDLDAWDTRVVAGVDLDRSPGERFERRIAPVREEGVFTDFEPGDVLYDYDVTFEQVSPYVQASAAPVARVRLSAGLRADFLRYDYRSALPPLDEGAHRRPADTRVGYRHLSPKLGATWDARDDLNLFAAYRHGFRAPAENQLFRQGTALSTVDLRPVRSNSFELGARGRAGGAVDWELTGYWMPKEDDIVAFVRPDGIRETQNAGRTLHRGIEAGLGVQPFEGVRVRAAYSYARHTYEAWRPRADLDLAGREMESAPREVGSAEIAVAPPSLGGARLALEWVRLGSYWMDAENTERYGGHDLLNLRVAVPVVDGLRLSGRLMNVTDARYAERAAFTAFRGRELAPGRPRTLFVGAEWRGRMR